jgi:hypothetical protein
MEKVVSRLLAILLLPLLIGLFMTACGGGGSDSSSTGTVQLAITDAVDRSFSEVVIAIKEVRAVPAEEETQNGESLPLIVEYDPPLVVNVLDLAYQQQFLGEAVLPAGHYSQLRLVLEVEPANYVVLEGETEQIPIKTPSGQESGLKVVGPFTVTAGEATAVILDFDPAKTIVEAGVSGNWIFKPTGIRVVQSEDILPNYGAIIGTVVEETTAGTPPVTSQSPVTTAKVYAVPNDGSEQPWAAGLVNSEDGSFRLFLPPVSTPDGYELQVKAEGFTSYSSLPTLYPVTTGVDTDAGDIVLDRVTTP